MLETMSVVAKASIWLPLTYIFYNIIFFYVGIWTLQDKENILPVAVVHALLFTPYKLYLSQVPCFP